MPSPNPVVIAKIYGIYDPSDCVWLGDDKGPITYDNLLLAKAAATVLTKRIGNLVQAKEYDPSPKKLRDHITPVMSGLEALQRVENCEL